MKLNWSDPDVPGTPARFEHWAKMPAWTIEEAICLWLGAEPGSLEFVRQDLFVDFFVELDRRRRWVQKAIAVGQLKLHSGSLKPRPFVDWTLAQEECVPDELLWGVPIADEEQVVEPQGKVERSSAAEVDQVAESAVDPRKWKNSLRMLLGMAMAKYGYDPRATRNEALKLIARDLAKYEFEMESRLIGDRLKEAVEVLGFDPLQKRE